MSSVDAKFGPDFIKNRFSNDIKYFEKARRCKNCFSFQICYLELPDVSGSS